MPTWFVVCFLLGCFVAFVGHVWLMVKGFQESALWGVGLFLIGFPINILFLIFHAYDAWKPFVTSMIGALIIGGTLVAAALQGDGLRRFSDPEYAGVPGAPTEEEAGDDLLPEGDLMQAREEVMNVESEVAAQTAGLQRMHAQLQALQAKLNSKDSAAVAAYNKQVESYQSQKISLDGRRAKLASMQSALERRIDSSPGGGGSGGGGAGVVIYTTKTCPACVSAKRYFSGRKIPFKEMDVEASPVARAEWEKFNARGVPVIVVKGQVMHGFNQGEIERLLGGA